jgi:hypothetical protein
MILKRSAQGGFYAPLRPMPVSSPDEEDLPPRRSEVQISTKKEYLDIYRQQQVNLRKQERITAELQIQHKKQQKPSVESSFRLTRPAVDLKMEQIRTSSVLDSLKYVKARVDSTRETTYNDVQHPNSKHVIGPLFA